MPTAYIEGPRHAVVTSDDHGAVLQIVAWLAMVLVILAAFLRLTIRFTNIRRPAVDDTFIVLAMVPYYAMGCRGSMADTFFRHSCLQYPK